MVEEPVEDRGGHGGIGEELAPVLEREVRGDDQAAGLVGRGDEPEQVIRPDPIERREPELVHHHGKRRRLQPRTAQNIDSRAGPAGVGTCPALPQSQIKNSPGPERQGR